MALSSHVHSPVLVTHTRPLNWQILVDYIWMLQALEQLPAVMDSLSQPQ